VLILAHTYISYNIQTHTLSFTLQYSPTTLTHSHTQAPTEKFSKKQHLNSHFHFAIEPQKRFLAQGAFRSADSHVDWDTVSLVIEPSGKLSACPVCLEPPVAAIITACAHVFCHACMLRTLSLSEFVWVKCPLCFERVEVSVCECV
jgi:hypothetical protein